MVSTLSRRMLPWASLIAFLALWQLTARLYPPEQFPAFTDVVKALSELAGSGALLNHIAISLIRFGIAYVAAVVTAIPLGLFLGRWPAARRAIDPVVQVLRPISPIAWFPLAVLWFGIGNAPAIFIIYLAAFYPILLSTVSAVVGIQPVFLKVATNFGASPWLVFRRVVLPAAFPRIMVGLHIAVGTAWIHLVAGEMLGAQSGLGFLIVDARNFLRTDLIMGGMLIVGVLGLGINRVMHWVESRFLERWGGAA